MKLTQGILGCALAAGLMTFAAGKAQAVVINNQNYIPFNLKLKASFEDGDKIKKHSFSSKDVLSDAGFNGKVTLALGPSTTETNPFDVYVIQNNGKNSTIIADLTTLGVMTVAPKGVAFADKKDTHTEAGTVTVSYFSEASEEATSDDFFDLDGVYTFKHKDNNNGNVNSNFKATSLSGSGFIGEIEVDENPNASLEGSASGSGGGKIED
jgi:hypothetical protein